MKVEYHKPPGLPEDLNSKLDISAGPDGVGGAPSTYRITGHHNGVSLDLVDIPFQQGALKDVRLVNGVTIEALLAVCRAHIEAHQRGRFKCEENTAALHHIELALHVLQRRTAVRAAQGVEGMALEHKKDDGKVPRISIDGENRLIISYGPSVKPVGFSVEELQSTWRQWPDNLGPALRHLRMPIRQAEWAVLEEVASTVAAKNGLKELRSFFQHVNPV